MKFRNRFALLCAVVLCLSLLAACGGTTPPPAPAPSEPSSVVTDVNENSEPVQVVFWHSMGGRNEEALTKIVEGFNKSQNKVVVEAQYQGTYDDAITKLRATGAGARPDIMQLYDVGTRWMIDSGYALKMQNYIDQDKYDISDYEPNILAYYSLEDGLHSMPFNCSSPVIIYNKTAAEKAGLDLNTAFSSFEKLEETAKILKEKGGVTVGGSFTNYSWVFEQLVGMQDKNLLDNGNGRQGRATKMAIDENGAGLAILNGYKSASKNPAMAFWGKGTSESKKQFATGTVGFIYDSCSIYVDTAAAAEGKFEIAFAPLPKVNAGDTGGTSVGGGSLWMIDNEDENRAAAAWQFIKYATDAEVQAQWAMGTGYLPIRKSSTDLPAFVTYCKDVNPGMMVAVNSLRNSKPSCAGSLMGVFPKARTIIENEVEILMNEAAVTPEQALAKIVEQINEEIDLYNKTN